MPSSHAGAAASALAPSLTFGTDTPSKSGWAPPRNILALPSRSSALASSSTATTLAPSADKPVAASQPASASPAKQPVATVLGFPTSQPASGAPSKLSLSSKPLLGAEPGGKNGLSATFEPPASGVSTSKAFGVSAPPALPAVFGQATDAAAAKPPVGLTMFETKPNDSADQAPKTTLESSFGLPSTVPAAALPAGPLEHAPPLRLDESSLKVESNSDSTFLKFARASSLLAQIPSPAASAGAAAAAAAAPPAAAASFAPKPSGFVLGASSRAGVVDKVG
jgi:hypothetical protein